MMVVCLLMSGRRPVDRPGAGGCCARQISFARVAALAYVPATSMPEHEHPDRLPVSATIRGRFFPATQWELVAQVSRGGESRRVALEELCRLYWYPVYAFLRRQGQSRTDAEDLTQGFFLKLLGDETIEAAEHDKGKLRTFLLAALHRHVTDRTRHDTAEKRGGGRVLVSFDAMAAEERYANEPADSRDPEWIFSHTWAQDLLGKVREKLRAAFEVAGRTQIFETLLPFLVWDEDPPSHLEVAQKLGTSVAASRVLILRLRKKFRDLLHEELATTVQSEEEIPGEIAWLRSVLAAR